MTTLHFIVDNTLARPAALDRRDEIIAHLKLIGLRLSMTDDGTDIYLSDGVPTIGDRLVGDRVDGEVPGLAADPQRDAVIAAEVAGHAAEYLGSVMRGGLDGADLPAAVNYGPAATMDGHLPGHTGVIDLEDGRRVILAAFVTRTPVTS